MEFNMNLKEAKQYLNKKGYELIDEGLFGSNFDADKVKAGYKELYGYLKDIGEKYEHKINVDAVTNRIKYVLNDMEKAPERAEKFHKSLKNDDELIISVNGYTHNYAIKMADEEPDRKNFYLDGTYEHLKHIFIKEIYPNLKKFGITSDLKTTNENEYTSKDTNKVIGTAGDFRLSFKGLKF